MRSRGVARRPSMPMPPTPRRRVAQGPPECRHSSNAVTEREIIGQPAHRERVETVLFDNAAGGLDHVRRGQRRCFGFSFHTG